MILVALVMDEVHLGVRAEVEEQEDVVSVIAQVCLRAILGQKTKMMRW
jgi:hypothetical protein